MHFCIFFQENIKAGDSEQLESERVKLVRKILKSKERISYLYQERTSAIGKVQKHLQNEREVLDWEVAENKKDIRERRQILEERINELEAEKDIAADKLAEAEIELNNKVAEEDRIIHAAQEQLFKLEEEILQTIRVDDTDLRAKQVKFDDENKKRSLLIANERQSVAELAEKVEKLRNNSVGSDEESELRDFEARLEEQKTQLRALEDNAIIEKKKAEELFAMASRDFKQKQAKREADLEAERKKVEELKNHKQNTIKQYAKKVGHFKEMVGDAQSKLQADRQKLKEVGLEAEALDQKLEDGVISIARKLSEGIETSSEGVSLESLICDLDVVSNAGRNEVSQKEETMSQELDKIQDSRKDLLESVKADEKEKESIENDLKEMREVFQKDRTGEKVEMMKFVEKIEGDEFTPADERYVAFLNTSVSMRM